VQKKALTRTQAEKFPTKVLQAPEDIFEAGEHCPVCMSEYEVGEVLRTLSCGHCFHSDCITHWLTTSSTKCPLDNISML